ncbi:hypothetical protein EMPG_17204 [Blastomyces silverae]|uniref:Uncharacterized protein n=1 Tax=Blastomyces silverae TaxID=2060906 RepID=A0A0H1B7B4_9EURO|nr:hypothetical protein EMPG_17204 [Blastomyces silverae]
MMYGMSTPARGPVNRFNIHNVWGPPLFLANKSLMSNPHPRDYSILPYRDPTPPTPKTQCYPHPLYPLEYWRAFASTKREGYIRLMRSEAGTTDVDDRRSSIDDAHYWRCEAMFWMSKSRFKEGRRRKISDANYWRCEADFWRTACAAKENQTSRVSIQNTEYWKCESRFWKSTCPRVHEDTRYDGIDDPKYWECENKLYERLLRALVNAEHEGPGYHQAMLRERGYGYDSDSAGESPKTPPRRSARLINLKQKAAVSSSASRSELHASTNASSTKKRKNEDQATNNNHRKRKLAR